MCFLSQLPLRLGLQFHSPGEDIKIVGVLSLSFCSLSPLREGETPWIDEICRNPTLLRACLSKAGHSTLEDERDLFVFLVLLFS